MTLLPVAKANLVVANGTKKALPPDQPKSGEPPGFKPDQAKEAFKPPLDPKDAAGNRKLIFTASLRLKVAEFAKAEQEVLQVVKAQKKATSPKQ